DFRARRVGRKTVGSYRSEADALHANAHFHRAETALKERPPRRVEAVALVPAGQRPRAADVIAAGDERIEIAVVDTLPQTLVGQPDVLGLDRERTRAPARFEADALPTAVDVEPRVIERIVELGPAAQVGDACRQIAIRE